MNETIRLGTIAGVRVGVNWSVLVIFALLLFGLAAGRFPLLYPGYDNAAYFAAGTVAAVVFFASLLAHEVAHAIVAQREGLEVEGITLWLFGGVARLAGEPSTPGADLRIAGVGPLVSLALGVGFGVIALLASSYGLSGLTLGVLGWLTLINLLLAGFNLVPAAPLDGGRILRGLLWMRTGDRVRAAVTAAKAGRQFGGLLVTLGILLAILTPGIGGLWFALIGWFIASAAGAEEQHAKIQGSLKDVLVRDVMTRDPLCVPTGLDVSSLLEEYVLRHRHSAYPVVDASGRPIGLVGLNDIRGVPADQRRSARVEEIATPIETVATAAPSQRLLDVIGRRSADAGRVLVLDGGNLVGIITATDIARAIELATLR